MRISPPASTARTRTVRERNIDEGAASRTRRTPITVCLSLLAQFGKLPAKPSFLARPLFFSRLLLLLLPPLNPQLSTRSPLILVKVVKSLPDSHLACS